MELRDVETWDEYCHTNMDSGYGLCAVMAAEWWADEMEQFIANGADLESIADEAFSIINKRMGRWGLTGFQYGVAVSMLAEVWKHGEQLRVWHNLKTQLRDEGTTANATGGVLNPALLSVQKETT